MAARIRPATSPAACLPARSARSRLLRLFEKWGIKTTWFIPGHSIETFPEQMKAVADAGHEIGMHGYSHENPVATTPEQEEAIFDKCIEVITKLSGKPPRGYVAPWWELGPNTAELLLRKGLKYDHSMMNNDFHPFYVRVGDSLDQDRLLQAPLDLDEAARRAARRPT